MNTKRTSTHKRDMLLKIFMEKKISFNTIEKISPIIGEVRREQGEEQAEILAEKITEIIKSSKTEEEILSQIEKIKD